MMFRMKLMCYGNVINECHQLNVLKDVVMPESFMFLSIQKLLTQEEFVTAQ